MSDSNDIAIKVEHISKTFHAESSSKTIKEAFVNIGHKLTGKKNYHNKKGDYTALKDINFTVKKGDFLGIVGRNGGGKSTLLKVLAGVYTPTTGSVDINGKLIPFIELGVGFNPELSGHDNVYLNAALLGFTRKQTDAMYNDIVDFAELHDFMDTKLKNYSSGMQVRLAFSVAIRAESDILLVDEVLAVGDSNFQAKCLKFFREYKNLNKTIILVSHDIGIVEAYCNRIVVISNNTIVFDGNTSDGISKYYDINQADKGDDARIISSKDIDIEMQNNGMTTKAIETGDDIAFQIKIPKNRKIKNVGLAIFRDDGVYCFGANTTENKFNNKQTFILKLPKITLLSGHYNVTVGLFGVTDKEVIGYAPNATTFEVKPKYIKQHGINTMEYQWYAK